MPNNPNRKFFRTVVEVEVFSEGPFDYQDLSCLAEAMVSGDLVGHYETKSQDEITRKEAADGLYRVHSEPGFFNIDDEGNDTDDFGDEDETPTEE